MHDENHAEIGEQVGVIGLAADGGAQRLDRRTELAPRLQRQAEAVMGRDQIGIDGERLPIGLDRGIGLAELLQHATARHVQLGIVRACFQRAAKRFIGVRPPLLHDAAATEERERDARSRIALEQPGDEGVGFGVIGIGEQHAGQIGDRLGGAGPGGDHVAIETDGLPALPLGGERIGEIDACVVPLGIERERAPVQGDGLVRPAAAAQQVAEVHVQRDMPRHELECPAVRRLRCLELSQVAPRIAQIEVSGPEIRLQRERLLIALDRGPEVALCRQRVAEVEPDLGDAWVLGQHAAEAIDGLVGTPELAQRAAESDQRVHIARVGGEPRPQRGDRLLGPSARGRHGANSPARRHASLAGGFLTGLLAHNHSRPK